jgi:hypothetical protein
LVDAQDGSVALVGSGISLKSVIDGHTETLTAVVEEYLKSAEKKRASE